MMGQFVVSNLFHRPVRTLIGVLAIAVEVMLVITIVGLTSGMLQETAAVHVQASLAPPRGRSAHGRTRPGPTGGAIWRAGLSQTGRARKVMRAGLCSMLRACRSAV